MMLVDNCLWCNSTNLDLFVIRKDGVKIIECKNCELIMLESIPNNLEQHYYTKDYYTDTKSNSDMGTGYDELYDLMAPAFLLWEQALIDSLIKDNNKLFLEIGCATGNLLDILRELNPRLFTYGIDISKYAVSVARLKGHNAHHVNVKDYKSSEKFDIIFSSETLEHLDDPKGFLGGIQRNLNKDGIFLFYVPSISKEQARAEGGDYVRFTNNLEHLLHFTPGFIEKSFSEYFGRNVAIREFDAGFGPYIVGAVSSDNSMLNKFTNIFEYIENEKDVNKNNRELLNLAIISLKFGKFKYAKKLLKHFKNIHKKNITEYNLVLGLEGYHKGELVKSSKYFEKYILDKPNSIIGLKSLLANERIISNIYQDELLDIKEKLDFEVNKSNPNFKNIVTRKAKKFINIVYNKSR